jgi:hypothetical protein
MNVTTWFDLVAILVIGVLVGLGNGFVVYVLESQRLSRQARVGEASALPDIDAHRKRFRTWHFGFVSMATCVLPYVLLCGGFVFVSFARDQGFVIFPWLILVPVGLFVVASSAAVIVRRIVGPQL